MKKWGIYAAILFVLVLASGCGQKESIQRTTPISSNSIVKKQDDSLLYIANIDVNTVTVMDTQQNKVVAEIPVGREPRQLALSPDETTLYVTCMFDNKVDIINTKDKKVTASIPVGIEPFGVLTNRDGSQVYVANYRSPSFKSAMPRGLSPGIRRTSCVALPPLFKSNTSKSSLPASSTNAFFIVPVHCLNVFEYLQ